MTIGFSLFVPTNLCRIQELALSFKRINFQQGILVSFPLGTMNADGIDHDLERSSCLYQHSFFLTSVLVTGCQALDATSRLVNNQQIVTLPMTSCLFSSSCKNVIKQPAHGEVRSTAFCTWLFPMQDGWMKRGGCAIMSNRWLDLSQDRCAAIARPPQAKE